MQQKKLYIAFEGTEGTGKSTQSKKLYEFLLSQNINAILTREPGGCTESEEIRHLLKNDKLDWDATAEIMLFACARHMNYQKTILPALAENKIVVADRSLWSSISMQGQSENGLEQIIASQRYFLGNLWPNVIIYMKANTETSLNRANARLDGNDRFEQRGVDYFIKADNLFTEILHDDLFYKKYNVPKPTILTIDANHSIEEIHHKIIEKITPILQ